MDVLFSCKEKITSGVFKQCIIPDDLDIADTHRFCNLGTKAWMWKGDDNKYNFYKPIDNQILCRESGVFFSCSYARMYVFQKFIDIQTL